jgi:hypothetical protein
MEVIDYKFWEKQTKDSWLEQVKKDNPEIPDSKFFRVIEENVLAKAFAFPTDIQHEGRILKSNNNIGSWKIGAKLQNENIQELISDLRLVLEHGVEYIHFLLPENINTDSFNQLIDDVYLDMLTTRWTFPTEEIMNHCREIIFHKFPNAQIFLHIGNSLNNNSHSGPVALCYQFPVFQSKDWVDVLMKMLNDLSIAKPVTTNLIFELQLNNDFLLNICSIRALKLVLRKIWNLFQLRQNYYFEINIDDQALGSDTHFNVIKLSAMALSASISGIDFLNLPPGDIKSDTGDKQWIKTSLHAMHILKQESHLSNLPDPLAGAYFIEDLTEQLAEKIWLKLQQEI